MSVVGIGLQALTPRLLLENALHEAETSHNAVLVLFKDEPGGEGVIVTYATHMPTEIWALASLEIQSLAFAKLHKKLVRD